MSIVEFNYRGKNIIIQCNRYEKIRLIFQKLSIKIGVNINSLLFLYSGQKLINYELTFDQIASKEDKIRNKMNIVVFDNYASSTSASSSISNPYSSNISNINAPIKNNIFETMENLNQRFINLEKEIKEESKNMKKKIELMKNRLMKATKKKIRFDAATYFGETIGKEITGLGIIENDDGNRYEGEMLNSDRSGIGIFYGVKGDIFIGEYIKNKRNGFGIEDNPRVGKYEGSWLDDCLTGTGILTFRTGGIYIGQMDKAQLSGFGKLIFLNGDYFIGTFKNGSRKQGKAFYSDENGIFDATWENDEKTKELIGKGIYYFADGRQEKRTRIIGEKDGVWKYY